MLYNIIYLLAFSFLVNANNAYLLFVLCAFLIYNKKHMHITIVRKDIAVDCSDVYPTEESTCETSGFQVETYPSAWTSFCTTGEKVLY